jgi:hypothetical protein
MFFVALALLVLAQFARAEVLVVSSAANDGPNSLRWAITEANLDDLSFDEVRRVISGCVIFIFLKTTCFADFDRASASNRRDYSTPRDYGLCFFTGQRGHAEWIRAHLGK